jgi:uncharacterized protein (DUF488 family)
MIERLFTTGVFGKTENQFFRELLEARIHTFCDIRRRRGVRGSQYSFVNSTRLQHLLAERSIAYRYFQELAPTKEIREAQHAIDAQQGVPKRMRQELGEEFKNRYVEGILSHFDSKRFAQGFDPNVSSIVLFCVEGNPKACHRSLLAERLRQDWGIPLEHL